MKYQIVMGQLPLQVVRERNELCRTPADIRAICADMADLAQESLQVLLLDSKNRVMDRILVTLGTLNASLVHPREIFRAAIVGNAAAVVLIHNHPSGDPTPSPEDIRVTKQVVEAGRIIDINVIDHVVISRLQGEGLGYVSMRESGMVCFA